jgi:hypothetical protein
MNAVEIEQAVSILAEAPFNAAEFPYAFLEAFGNKATTITILKSGKSNNTDVAGAVLQRNNIHIKVCTEGQVPATLKQLRESPATGRQKAKYILATDGITLESERLTDGETLACEFARFPDRFTFFLPLAGISTVRQIDESAFDIRATSRLNRLYVELLKVNPDWDADNRREEMNHFFARLIFCFFAEDTNIFRAPTLFTATLEQFTDRESSNTHEVISEIFRAMRVKSSEQDRKAAKLPSWANQFPYVNGGLFSGSLAVPKFSKIARSYLLHVGNLDWKQINPDIFGSMIQAVADDEERGALGMHYTSVPNILKVLNPLFLDDLREKLEEAGDNSRKLLHLRNRMARIRVFDPACGSGNFLVIAYKEMRTIEAEINRRRGEADRRSVIPLTNFRGIELRHLSCEIARLALIIAEYQCDVLYRGERLALAEFLPLEADNWITHGNALRLDWLSICPPTGEQVKHRGDDLFSKPVDQAEVEFENEGGETYICGNPPYSGKGKLDSGQKSDMAFVFQGRTKNWGYIDYVGAWFVKACDFCRSSSAAAAFVSTNSIVMGRQAPTLWPVLLSDGVRIRFAHTSFVWANNAANNAAVFCVIVGVDRGTSECCEIYSEDIVRQVSSISHYLTAGAAPLVVPQARPVSQDLPDMILGNMPNDGGALSLTHSERLDFIAEQPDSELFIRRFYGSREFNNDLVRYCLWISDARLDQASRINRIKERIEASRASRLSMPDASNRKLAERPHQMREFNEAQTRWFIVPRMTSERRKFLPCGILSSKSIVSSQAFAIVDGDLWTLALLLSRIHLVWIGTICGKFKEDFRYSSDLGWHSFPVPTLTAQNKADLTRCAEEILLARESHFPATIADLYDPEKMPEDLREAHDRNDEALERIYIGRRFKNDTERLEKLFEMYTRMTAKRTTKKASKKSGGRKRKGADA